MLLTGCLFLLVCEREIRGIQRLLCTLLCTQWYRSEPITTRGASLACVKEASFIGLACRIRVGSGLLVRRYRGWTYAVEEPSENGVFSNRFFIALRRFLSGRDWTTDDARTEDCDFDCF
jgi:hypothetical protein